MEIDADFIDMMRRDVAIQEAAERAQHMDPEQLIVMLNDGTQILVDIWASGEREASVKRPGQQVWSPARVDKVPF